MKTKHSIVPICFRNKMYFWNENKGYYNEVAKD